MEKQIWDIIARALAGEASAEEQSTLEAWKAASPDNALQYNEAKAAWEASTNAPAFQPDVDAAWNKVWSSITEAEKEDAKVVPIQKGFSNRNKWILRIAAAVTLLLGAALVFNFMGGTDNAAMNLVAEATDGIQEVVLPDGTTVTLNEGSTLRYPENFEGDERMVSLSGEAFFDVIKNPDQPFVISNGVTRTEVLGTSFNLRTRKKDTEHQLVVHTGKVSFKGTHAEALILHPGDEGTYIDAGEASVATIAKAPTANDLSWKTGKLVFNDTPITDVLEDLEDHYNTRFVLKGNFSNISFSERFENTSLDEILLVIEEALSLQFNKESDAIIVTR